MSLSVAHGLRHGAAGALANFRAGSEGEAIAGEVAALAERGLAPREPELKRVPVPCPANHPRAELLRRKGLALWRAPNESDRAAPLPALERHFNALAPLVRRLMEI